MILFNNVIFLYFLPFKYNNYCKFKFFITCFDLNKASQRNIFDFRRELKYEDDTKLRK